MCESANFRKSWHFTLWLRPYALRGPLTRGEGVPPGPSGQVRGWLVHRDAGVALSRPLTLSTTPFGSFSARLLLVARHASRAAIVECCCATECDGGLVVGVDIALAGSALVAAVDASVPIASQYGFGPASVLLGGGAGCASIGPCHDGYGSDLGCPQPLCLSPGQGPMFIGGSHIRSSWTTTQKNPLVSLIDIHPLPGDRVVMSGTDPLDRDAQPMQCLIDPAPW